jgi:hypothetical protein
MDNKHRNREHAKAMRAAGKTYREIGEALGVSKQRAEQLVKRPTGDYLHVGTVQKIPYKGLREWMLANRVGITKLGELCGCEVKRPVKGNGMNKHTIDAILRVTGLDYETCFEVG